MTAVICYVLDIVGRLFNQGGDKPPEKSKMTYTLSSGLSVLPLSLVFVGMITLNNICLKYVEVSFYNGITMMQLFVCRSNPLHSCQITVHCIQRSAYLLYPWKDYLLVHLWHSANSDIRLLPGHRRRDELFSVRDPGRCRVLCLRVTELHLHSQSTPQSEQRQKYLVVLQ